MNGKLLLLASLLYMGLTACSSGAPPAGPGLLPSGNVVPRAAYQDISRMKLADGLSAKYTRLQLFCGGETTSYQPTDNGVLTVTETLVPAMVWDVLKAQTPPTTPFTLTDATGQVQYVTTFSNLAVSLATKQYSSSDTPPKVYHFINSAQLTGTKSTTVKWYDNAGNLISTDTGTETPGDTVFPENVSIPVTDITEGNRDPSTPPTSEGYHLKLNCTLQADIRPGFETDTTIDPPPKP